MKQDTPYNCQIWNSSLHSYVLNGKIPEKQKSLLHHVLSMNTENARDQILLLQSISNYHWWQYVRTDGDISSKNIHVNLHDHLMYHPSCDSHDYSLRHKLMPKSPRNRVMYYILAGDFYTESVVLSTIEKLLQIDSFNDGNLPDDEETFHKSKRRKYSPQIVKVTKELLCNHMGISMENVSNSVSRNNGIYITFKEQLINDGTIMWRQHNNLKDTVVMSDYNPTTGFLSPLSYVHVTSTKCDNQTLLKCSCHIYNAIQCAALSQVPLSNEDIYLHESMTCMHCRFFTEMLEEFQQNLYNIQSTSITARKVKSSLCTINNPILLMGIASQCSTTKLSVVSEEDMSIVHISFNTNNTCYANCQNGMCKAKLLNKKKIPKSVSIHENKHLCCHIQSLFANFEQLENIFPEYFNFKNCQQEEREEIPSNMDVPEVQILEHNETLSGTGRVSILHSVVSFHHIICNVH